MAGNKKIDDNNVLYYDDSVFLGGELIQSYYHRFVNYGAINNHYHNFYELNVVIKGNGKHYVDKREFDIQKGSMFIIPPFVNHGYIFDNNDFTIFHILFHNLFFDKYDKFLKSLYGFNIVFDIEPYLRLHRTDSNFLLSLNSQRFASLVPDFDRLVKMEKEDENNSQQKKEFLTLYIISAICENTEDYKKANKDYDESLFYVLKATEYMQNNFADKITLENLCAETNMSRSSFLRHFKSCYNCTPIEYLNSYRINQSKILLRETDKSIVTIAQDCGFFDSSHFIRFFSKKEGISPMKYRMSFNEENDARK